MTGQLRLLLLHGDHSHQSYIANSIIHNIMPSHHIPSQLDMALVTSHLCCAC